MPASTLCRVRISMWDRISSSISASSSRLRNSALTRSRNFRHVFIPTSGRLHDLADGQAKPVPAFAFDSQLLAAHFGQRVIFRPPVIFGLPPLGFDPTAVL